MPLTNTACKNAKPGAKPYKLTDSQGLYLEVMPHGSKLWRWKFRFNGKEKRLAFGTYPAISLQEARELRDKARKTLTTGTDPSFAKKEEKRQRALNAGNTFESIAREWHKNNLVRWSEGHGKTTLHRLETDIFPDIGYRPIRDISAPELLDALRVIEKRGAHEIAHRALQTCGQIFRYAIATGRADRNPAADLRGALRPSAKGHYAALDTKELPAFLRALESNDARLYRHTRLAMKLLAMTFVRTGELIKAKWDEIDLDGRQWIIPAERMKMRKPHIVPLSRQAVTVLTELKEAGGNSDWVFPSQVSIRKHMSNNTILKALERMGYKGKATGHGFRAVAMSSIKEDLGYRHEVVDRQLAHAPRSKVDAAYDRAAFLTERKTMMQDWADHLDSMAAGGKVIIGKFSGGRRK